MGHLDRLIGANPDLLHEVGVTFRRTSGTLHDARSHATAAVRGLDWVGPDADRFRETWETRVRRALDDLTDEVDRLGMAAIRQADEQAQVSSRTGTVTGVWLPRRVDRSA